MNNFYKTVIAAVNPTGLPAGEYKGSFIYSCPASSNGKINVILRIFDSFSPLTVFPASLTFSVPAAVQNSTASISVSSLTSPVSVFVTSDSSWLLVANPFAFPFAQLLTPLNVPIQASAVGLSAGTYHGNLAVFPIPPELAQPFTIPVTFFVASDVPLPQAGPPLPVSVVNGISGITGPLTPGEIVTVFGQNIGPDYPSTDDAGGTSILFNGIPGTILFASPTQTNVSVPPGLQAASAVLVEVERNGVRASAGTYPFTVFLQ